MKKHPCPSVWCFPNRDPTMMAGDDAKSALMAIRWSQSQRRVRFHIRTALRYPGGVVAAYHTHALT